MARRLLPILLLLSAWAVGPAAGEGPVYKLLWSPGSLDTPGGQPAVIFEVSPGLFYVLGLSVQSTYGASAFSITSAGTYKLLYSLPPYFNSSALVQATNGRLYSPGFKGETQQNLYFSTTAAGSELVQYPFPGSWGSAFQTIVAPGELFDIVGVATAGASIFGFGEISEAGRITILHQFSASDGVPHGFNIALGSDGNFYGIGNQTTSENSPGFIFRFTPKGEYSRLLTFPNFPAKNGFLSLMAASDGNLYGLFGGGGPSNSGMLYRATLSGQFQTLAYFPPDMAVPQTLVQASDGNIYGSTNSSTNYPSAIFRYDMTTHALTTAYRFADYGTQGICYCPLVQGMDGKIYGVTGNGGPWPGNGAVFSIDLGLPRPKPTVTALYPAAGAVGQSVMLWGKYLLAATSVTFNGVAATNVHVTSGQSAWATVPAGATSGPVAITTPNGSFTTTQIFTVQ
jgi:hypothetical protein